MMMDNSERRDSHFFCKFVRPYSQAECDGRLGLLTSNDEDDNYGFNRSRPRSPPADPYRRDPYREPLSRGLSPTIVRPKYY